MIIVNLSVKEEECGAGRQDRKTRQEEEDEDEERESIKQLLWHPHDKRH
jgi:hypothetical protein